MKRSLEIKIKSRFLERLLLIAIGLILICISLRFLNPPKSGYEGEIEILVAELKRELPRIRGLPEPREVEVHVVDSKWVLENWGKQSISDVEKVKLDEEIFKFLLLINERCNLSEYMLKWSGLTLSAVIGNQLYVVKDYFDPKSPNARRSLMHELMHVVQSQEFRLPERKTTDGKYALNAIIEGDADFTADKYVNESISKLSTIIRGNSFNMNDIGDFDQLLKFWSFPYKYGEKFISYLYALGGWSLVNRVYLSPPNSTEQVIHPEKYISGESFQSIYISFTNTSWHLKRTDRMGEYFIYIVLSKWLDESTSIQVAEGWDGDRLNIYSNGENYFLIWRIKWENHYEAEEFYFSFNKICESAGAENLFIGLNRSSWRIGGRTLSIEVDDDQTVIIGLKIVA